MTRPRPIGKTRALRRAGDDLVDHDGIERAVNHQGAIRDGQHHIAMSNDQRLGLGEAEHQIGVDGGRSRLSMAFRRLRSTRSCDRVLGGWDCLHTSTNAQAGLPEPTLWIEMLHFSLLARTGPAEPISRCPLIEVDPLGVHHRQNFGHANTGASLVLLAPLLVKRVSGPGFPRGLARKSSCNGML
jgi:hypothetical protein